MENSDLYLQKINAQIDKYSAELALTRSKATVVHVDIKLEYLNQVEKVKKKRDGLKKKYKEISKASESLWEDIKEVTENAWNDLK
jgi:uncharacterized coiled-coil DUF342 family protein